MRAGVSEPCVMSTKPNMAVVRMCTVHDSVYIEYGLQLVHDIMTGASILGGPTQYFAKGAMHQSGPSNN